MIRKVLLKLLIAFLFISGFCRNNLQADETGWKKIDEGFFLGQFESPQKSAYGDSSITIIKISPKYYSFKLLCAKENGLRRMTVKDWCNKFGLIAGINAGMFQTDYLSNVGYMKNFAHINNARKATKHLSVFAFNPNDPPDIEARVFDIDEENIDTILQKYNTVIQNLRLIKRPGKNKWPQQNQKWSEAALGEDKEGNILFIFCRTPYSMHDLNNILLSLPIDLVCAQHLEGGPVASLYFSYKGIEMNKVGSFETRFNESEKNNTALPVPNIIGVVKK